MNRAPSDRPVKSNDARFEDAAFADKPLRLFARDTDDLTVVSALCQDALGLTQDIAWMRRRARCVIMLNRFRWEDKSAAGRHKRRFERVRSALVFDSVLAVQANGISATEPETVFAILQMTFDPTEDAAGAILLDLAGDGAMRLEVECLDARLIDLTRPWHALSGSAPDHDLGDY